MMIWHRVSLVRYIHIVLFLQLITFRRTITTLLPWTLTWNDVLPVIIINPRDFISIIVDCDSFEMVIIFRIIDCCVLMLLHVKLLLCLALIRLRRIKFYDFAFRAPSVLLHLEKIDIDCNLVHHINSAATVFMNNNDLTFRCVTILIISLSFLTAARINLFLSFEFHEFHKSFLRLGIDWKRSFWGFLQIAFECFF